MRAYRLRNSLQTYAWGSVEGLEACLGIPNPTKAPHAELWIGAHPKAPSFIETEGGEQGLDEVIRGDAKACLGAATVERFGPVLPFLLKALSAARPLSIQAHPAKRKAEKGFERENLAGIPLDADERNYRDRNHKPELVMALTPFEGLFGFRPIPEIISNIKLIAPFNAKKYISRLERNPGRVELSVLFYSLITADEATKAEILSGTGAVLPQILARRDLEPRLRTGFEWMARLRAYYPDDMGVFAPLILNCVTLQPGEALFVGAGVLHAYLKGEALELMANSDNVIRGGLTGKHVDVPELISVLSFDTQAAEPVTALPQGAGIAAFPDFVPDFGLQVLRPAEAGGRLALEVRGPELLLCASGSLVLEEGGAALSLGRGEAAFVRADAESYVISGQGDVFRAHLPA